jgi:hypothetical protein
MSFTVSGLNNGTATPLLEPRLSATEQQSDPDAVGTVLVWVIGVVSGVAVMIGFLIVLY